MAKSCSLVAKAGTTAAIVGLGAFGGYAAANKWGYKLSTTLPWSIIGAITGSVVGVLVSLPVASKVSGCKRG